MTRLKNFIEKIQSRFVSAARDDRSAQLISIKTALHSLSVAYGGWMGIRAHLYEKDVLSSKRLPCRVVSIGNIVAGGTGKTPMTVLVAQMIKDMGYHVAVISRGYRGRMENRGGVVSDGNRIINGPQDAGDEPYLMARLLKGIPVVVGSRRYESGMMAVKRFHPDVIVLDDAFQHMRLERDLNLVLLDSRAPLGNGHLLPRGLLREPKSALNRAHAIVYTRCRHAADASAFDAVPGGKRPVFYTAHTQIIRAERLEDGTLLNDATEISVLQGKKAVAFCGLADNQQFFDGLEQAGCVLVHTFSFADHHLYGCRDLNRIAETAREKAADLLITTYKDFVKIEKKESWPVALMAVDVTIQVLGDQRRFFNFISRALKVPDNGLPKNK
jgi:tetraacyldisaccharide 4'-kinase